MKLVLTKKIMELNHLSSLLVQQTFFPNLTNIYSHIFLIKKMKQNKKRKIVFVSKIATKEVLQSN